MGRRLLNRDMAVTANLNKVMDSRSLMEDMVAMVLEGTLLKDTIHSNNRLRQGGVADWEPVVELHWVSEVVCSVECYWEKRLIVEMAEEMAAEGMTAEEEMAEEEMAEEEETSSRRWKIGSQS